MVLAIYPGIRYALPTVSLEFTGAYFWGLPDKVVVTTMM